MAVNGRDTTIDWLTRRTLAGKRGPQNVCPDPETLAAYYERSLDPSEMARYEIHLADCAHCREHLALMVRSEEQPLPASPQRWFWDWRFLTAAAVCLLALAVWGLRSSSSPHVASTANEPLVAMSRSEQSPALQSATPPQTSSSAAPNPSASSSHNALIAPRASDRPTASAQPPASAQPRATERQTISPREKKTLPSNGRSYEDLLKVEPRAKAASQPDAVAEAQKEQTLTAPAASGSPQAPNASPQPPQPTGNVLGGLVGSVAASKDANAKAGANVGANADDKRSAAAASSPTQAQAAPRAPALGSATSGAVAALPQQRSTSTIIPTPDPKIMWRIAGGNFIERTEDGGASWHGQVADEDSILNSGSAPTSKICWLVGKTGMIVITKDAKQWKKIPPPVPADFVSVQAKNGSSATVVAADGQKFSTDNEGKKWVPVR